MRTSIIFPVCSCLLSFFAAKNNDTFDLFFISSFESKLTNKLCLVFSVSIWIEFNEKQSKWGRMLIYNTHWWSTFHYYVGSRMLAHLFSSAFNTCQPKYPSDNEYVEQMSKRNESRREICQIMFAFFHAILKARRRVPSCIKRRHWKKT